MYSEDTAALSVAWFHVLYYTTCSVHMRQSAICILHCAIYILHCAIYILHWCARVFTVGSIDDHAHHGTMLQ